MKRTNRERIATLLILFIWISSLFGQRSDLSSPYHTTETHMGNLTRDEYHPDIAATTIHPSITDSLQRVTIALQIKRTFDAKGLYVSMAQIPRDPDYTDSLNDNQFFTYFPEELPQIYLEKVGSQWFYARSSCLAVDDIYESIFPTWLRDSIDKLPFNAEKEILGIAIWQLLGFLILIGLVYLFHMVLKLMFHLIIEKTAWERLHIGKEHRIKFSRLARYISLIIVLYFFTLALPSLLLSITYSLSIYKVIQIMQAVFLGLVFIQCANILGVYLDMITARTESKMDDQLVPVFMKVIKIIIYVGVVFKILALLGVNVTALIAGVSIGGLALALAAQDTVKNFLGSLMIFFDKPFHVGDYVNTGEVEGTVEEVGFRSTRIRKIDTSLVSVPNGNMANITLTNIGVRPYRIFETTLGFTYNSKPENLEKMVSDLKSLIQENEQLNQNTWFVSLRNLGASSMDIFFRVFIIAADFKTELQVREAIIFKIIGLAEKNNLSFAFPSTSVYVEQMPEKKSDA